MKRAPFPRLIPAYALLLLAACGGGEGGAEPAPPGVTPDPLSLTFGPYHLEPGEELDFCEYFEVDSDDPTFLTRIAVESLGRTHHTFLYKTTLDHAPGRDACPDAAQKLFDADGIHASTYAQAPTQLPDGVAIGLEPRQRMFINIHLLNASASPADEEVKLTLDRGDAARAWTPVGFFEFTTFEITIPPHAEATAGNECVFPRDASVVSMTSHSHDRTTLVTANRWDGAAAEGEEVFRSERWDEPAVLFFEQGLEVKGGQGFSFTCHYRNDDAFEVTYGETASEEMCYLLGYYYPGPDTIICAL